MNARLLLSTLAALMVATSLAGVARPHASMHPAPMVQPQPQVQAQPHPTTIKHMVPPARPAIHVPVYVPVYVPYAFAPWPRFGTLGLMDMNTTLCQSLTAPTLGDLGTSNPSAWFAPVALSGSPPTFDSLPSAQTTLSQSALCAVPASTWFSFSFGD